MIRMVIAGMKKEEMARIVYSVAGDRIDTRTCSDLEGAMSVKSGKADYYLGACLSGAGGALALVTGMLGSEAVVRLSGTGAPPRAEDIEQAVRDGKVAFGLATDHILQVIPVLVRTILMAHEQDSGA